MQCHRISLSRNLANLTLTRLFKNEYSKEAVFSEAEIVLVYIDVSEKTADAARRSFSTA